MIYSLSVSASDSKADRLPYAIHDLCDVCSKCRARHIEEHGFVAARDIESDAARTDGVFVGNYSADWHGIALVMIGHQSNFVCCLRTRLDLTECAFVRRTPHGNVVDDLHF